MHRTVLASIALLAAACNPQNAQIVSGDYTAWLAATNSVTLKKWAPDLDTLEEFQAEFERVKVVDCRDFEDGNNDALRLPGYEKICGKEGQWPPTHESWLTQNGFYALGNPLEVWRGEAIITSEGDAQLGFHVNLPGGRDFRFQLAVDPDFQPRQCRLSEDGTEVEYAPVDGDWVAEWSKDVESGTMYYLNAGTRQFDPDSLYWSGQAVPGDYGGPVQWFFPNEWEAGFAQGRFADDQFTLRPTRYAAPSAFINVDNDFSADYARRDEILGCPEMPAGVPELDMLCDYDVEVLGPNNEVRTAFDLGERLERTRTIAREVEAELLRFGMADDAELPPIKPYLHDNLWRESDGRKQGIDGWAELNYSWIRFDEGSSFEAGGAASGEFNLFFDGLASQSRFHVRARFEIDAWADDFWTTEYLPPIKFEENGSTLCGSTDIP